MGVGCIEGRVVMGGSLGLFCVGRLGVEDIYWFLVGRVYGVCDALGFVRRGGFLVLGY